MVKTNKPTGLAMLSAFSMPSGPDDPRLMSIEDVNRAVDDLTDNVSPTSASGETLESLTEKVWANHNARPKMETPPDLTAYTHHDDGDREARRARGQKEPKSLDEIRASAWKRFNNPPKGETLGGSR